SITYAGPAGFGELNLTVLVKGNSVPAAVLVDGHPEGQAPMFMPLSPGKHLIVIQRRPFPENVLPIEIKARATTRLEVELQELASGDAL
ncbi:MAG: PEGA domain-containing protein, partial [Myxococcaceae bacterium]